MTTQTVEYEWSDADLALLAALKKQNGKLPADAPRALLSIRLSVFTDDTTSPVRQELDLWREATDQGYRVVGRASDLNVRATKVPPWKRRELGAWLNDRVPEFDAIFFWKLDRFIRSLNDLHEMVRWASKYDKNLVSLNDPIDLSTTMGKMMVTFIGGIAEIESANTRTRVESMWAYAKTQEEWITGRPPYGYETHRATDRCAGTPGHEHCVPGKKTLLVVSEERDALRAAYDRLMSDPDASVTAVAGELGTTASTLWKRLRNPAMMGVRVERPDTSKPSQIAYDGNGQTMQVGPPIFTRDEWDQLQQALDGRGKKQPPRNKVSIFLGVLYCADCGQTMREQRQLTTSRRYVYLRCTGCQAGGHGIPNPSETVYDQIALKVLDLLGDLPVQEREYAKGEEARAQIRDLQERVAYYMKGLEPGGRFTKTRFAEDQATTALNAAIEELEKIDPSSAEDRWVYRGTGRTFRQHWEEGGMEAMADDLQRSGVECVVTRARVPGVRAPKVTVQLRIPQDIRDRLIVRPSDFDRAI